MTNGENKQARYAELVQKRKNCRLCHPDLLNPNICLDGAYDAWNHIGPWAQWQGNLDAELMVVGQDWGGVDYYVKHRGLEEDDNRANTNIRRLLAFINIEIELPPNPMPPGKVFFTNAVLCLKPGQLGGAVPPVCFRNCAGFLREQIELINPKVVVTLGLPAYQSVAAEFGQHPLTAMNAALQIESIQITKCTSLVPVMHPGYFGFLKRTLEQHQTDWRRVRLALDKSAE